MMFLYCNSRIRYHCVVLQDCVQNAGNCVCTLYIILHCRAEEAVQLLQSKRVGWSLYIYCTHCIVCNVYIVSQKRRCNYCSLSALLGLFIACLCFSQAYLGLPACLLYHTFEHINLNLKREPPVWLPYKLA